ncbi:MAG: hypothetical protein AAF108_06270 [Planctomycetota bacterium]
MKVPDVPHNPPLNRTKPDTSETPGRSPQETYQRTNGMNYQELLQNAALDVLGVLDPDESDRFAKAFDNASPGVRARIRLEQTRLADFDELLPDVRPPADMRAKVIARVNAEAGRPAAATSVIPELAPDLHSDLDIASFRSVVAGVDPAAGPAGRSVIGRIGVTPIWRAAAIALGAATIVFSGSTVLLSRQIEDISAQTFTQDTLNVTTKLGGLFAEQLLSPDAVRVAFEQHSPADRVGDARAMIIFEPSTGRGTLAFRNLPITSPSEQLMLVELGEDGTISSTIARLTPGDGLSSSQVGFTVEALPKRIAIVAVTIDEPASVLLSARIS